MRLALISTLAAVVALTAAEPPARPAASFSVSRPGAAPFTLAQYRGKIVLLAFIETHCSHCQKLTGFLNEMAPKFAPRGVQVLECAFNEDAPGDLANFQRQFRPSFPLGYSDRGAVLAFLQIPMLDPHPLYVPHLVFLDRKGMIRGDIAGESAFMRQFETNIPAELEKLLQPPAKASAAVKK